MKLSVLIPLFNEEKTIGQILEKLLRQKIISEVIIVDDGSTDDSATIVKKFVKKSKKIKLFQKENAGKGSAIRLALQKATGDYVLIQDADLEYDPEDIPVLVEPVLKGRAAVIYGSRFIGAHSNLLFWHRIGNILLNFLINLLYNTTLSDMETCYKLLPTKLMKSLQLTADKFDLEPEITCKILKKGIRIYEVPINYMGRDFNEGKKTTWKDGFGALRMILALKLLV